MANYSTFDKVPSDDVLDRPLFVDVPIDAESINDEDLIAFDGFSTSIYDMHADDEDCCAMAGCGFCLQARNHHIYHRDEAGYTPKSFWKSILLYGLPAVIYMLVLSQEITPDENDNENKKEDDKENDSENNSIIANATLALYLWYCILSILKKIESAKFRRKLRHHTLQSNGNVPHKIGMEAKDDLVHSSYGFYHTRLTEFERLRNVSQHNRGVDFCTKLWNLVSSLCCGGCCSCWCMCCGICALAQENRQMKKLFPPKAFRIDFITHQPWDEYFPRLQALRNSDNMSMASHFSFSNLSKLSILLLKLSLSLLLFLLILALSSIDSAFTWENMVVLMFTLGQAVFVLYAVHWYYCRLDLSLDAVIKYFASGFVLGTSTAFIIEAIISAINMLGLYAAFFMLNLSSPTISFNFLTLDSAFYLSWTDYVDEPSVSASISSFSFYFIIYPIYLFVNAFVVAGLTEELCKYFSYKMLRHPDLDYLVDAAANPFQTRNKSQGSAITIAMITVATGFACCENLLYVFRRSGGTVEDELSVLILRSLFPIHPIAAALQSIHVIRHDVEGLSSVKIGQIIFPAVILHGSFDFILFLLSFYVKEYNICKTDSKDIGNNDEASPSSECIFYSSVLPFIICTTIMVTGLFYYFIKATRQNKRIEKLEIQTDLIEGTLI